MTFERSASTPNEYRALRRHANALRFGISKVWALGEWQTADGDPVYFPSMPIEVKKTGWKYFHIPVDDVVRPCKPADNPSRQEGYLRIKFSQVSEKADESD